MQIRLSLGEGRILCGMARAARNCILSGLWSVGAGGPRASLAAALGLAGAGCGEQGPGLKAAHLICNMQEPEDPWIPRGRFQGLKAGKECRIWPGRTKGMPQGLKPAVLLARNGTAEAVPLQE